MYNVLIEGLNIYTPETDNATEFNNSIFPREKFI